jgi:hypothetical protein
MSAEIRRRACMQGVYQEATSTRRTIVNSSSLQVSGDGKGMVRGFD